MKTAGNEDQMSSQASPISVAGGSVLKVPRWLVLDITVAANANQQPGLIQIPADADFELWFFGVTRTSPLLKLLITESGTARPWIFAGSNQQGNFSGINIDLLAGTAAGNALFPVGVPYVMPASRTYQFLFTDTSGAPNQVELALIGFALFNQ